MIDPVTDPAAARAANLGLGAVAEAPNQVPGEKTGAAITVGAGAGQRRAPDPGAGTLRWESTLDGRTRAARAGSTSS